MIWFGPSAGVAISNMWPMAARRLVYRSSLRVRLLRDWPSRMASRHAAQEARGLSNTNGGIRNMGPIELLVGALITVVVGVAVGYAIDFIHQQFF